jgi:hypothetical protein
MANELRPATFAECLEQIVILLNAGDKAFEILLGYESGTEIQDDLTRLSNGLRNHPVLDEIIMDIMDGQL